MEGGDGDSPTNTPSHLPAISPNHPNHPISPNHPNHPIPTDVTCQQ